MASLTKPAFCKFCYDCKQPKTVYTSHYTKDKSGPEGVVICPLILSSECRYCHEKGHLKKCCPKLMRKKRGSKQYKKSKKETKRVAMVEKSTPKNDWTTVINNRKELRVNFANPISTNIGSKFPTPVALPQPKGVWATKQTPPTKAEEPPKKEIPKVSTTENAIKLFDSKISTAKENIAKNKKIEQELYTVWKKYDDAGLWADWEDEEIALEKLEAQRSIVNKLEMELNILREISSGF